MATTIRVDAADKKAGMTVEEIRDALRDADDADIITVTTTWKGRVQTVTIRQD